MPLRPRLQLRLRRGGILRVKRTAVGAQVPLQQAERVPAVSGVLNLPEMAKGKGKVTVVYVNRLDHFVGRGTGGVAMTTNLPTFEIHFVHSNSG